MLVGRDDERLALDRLLAEARAGRSGVIALVGEPGIGKTALLDHTARAADGMRALRARGIESEAGVPFAALAELLRPALAALERIPGPQASALSGALALEPAGAQHRFAVGAATLSLLSAWADDGPVLALIDDAQWLDAASAEALLFAARRLLADPIALVFAVREGEPSLIDGSDLRVLRLGGLNRGDAAELMRVHGVTGGALERLYAATAGNPLALLELAPQTERLAALPGAAPLPLSSRIVDAFGQRALGLSETARRVLLIAAAEDRGDLAAIARAAGAAGADVTELAAAEEAGLLALTQGRAEFRHPLARAAVYAAASPQERRAAHAALAAALPDRDLDRRAWHLAAAAIGPDATASKALAQAGERARRRSAFAVAAGAFERGAQLSPADADRSRLLAAAADAAWLGGDAARTLRLLADARAAVQDDVALTARIDLLEGYVALRRGPVMRGYELTATAAELVAGEDPDLAVARLAEAVLACVYCGNRAGMLHAAERATALAQDGSALAQFYAQMAQGMTLVADGAGDAGATAVRRAIAIIEASGELPEDPRALVWMAFGPMWLRESGAGRDLIGRLLERARARSAIGALPTLLANLGRDQATTDRWREAEASFDEAIRLARETGQRTELAEAIAGLAWLEARQGREDACRAHAAEAAELAQTMGLTMFHIWSLQALGDLELGAGRPAAAVVQHEAQSATLRTAGIADVDLSPAPELVDSYLRLGRRDDAATATAGFAEQAAAKGQPWALARALRCRALLAEPAEAEALFEQALALHAQTPDGFEAARTQLAYGAYLRRGRLRIRARAQLRAALEAFERLGARAWADQAAAELVATGESARRRDPSTLDDLTPQERQIAGLLAAGRTTRETAAAVFLSPKTVEYHLRNVYRKLGISSREQLAEAFGR